MPAVTPSKPPKGWATYPTSGASWSSWLDVKHCVSPSVWIYAKKVFAYSGTGWVEVWNNRPVANTGSATSPTSFSISLTGTVDPNNFSTVPRFYYKKSTDATYTAGAALTTLSGDTTQSVSAFVVSGLPENTTYNYYLSATNDAGTSDIGTINTITTGVDCQQLGLANGWTETTVISQVPCGCSGSRTRTTKTYTKTGCTSYNVVTDAATCVGDCAAGNTTCYTVTTSTVYSGICGNRTTATRTTYTAKVGTGCTSYFTDSTYVASPDCNGTCYGTPVVTTEYYDGSCSSRRVRDKTVTPANVGSGCTDIITYSAPYSQPSCISSCYDTGTASIVYTGTCGNRTAVNRTTYQPLAGNTCPSYFTDSAPYAASDCANLTCYTKSAAKTTTTTNPCGCSGNQTGTYYTYTAIAGNGCTTFDSAITWDGACTGNCSTADTDCYTSSAVDCSGCGSATSYVPKAGTGCTATTIGSCGTYNRIPAYVYSSILFNFLGDGVDWYPIENYLGDGLGGYTPSNAFHGNSCYEPSYALWFLYRCSAGYTDNSRVGQYEANTGQCGYFGY